VLRADIAHRVGDTELALRLDVGPGRCLALAGPSGAGKTTVLRLLAGTTRPRSARITCRDEVWVDTESGVFMPAEERRCGYVFQDYALFPHLSAWRNVAFGLRGSSDRREQAVAMLEQFGLGDKLDAKPGQLSGGERQRVALARALAPRPRALLLDEPLSALDARTRSSATRELAEILRSLEVPVVRVTDDFGEAALLGDEVCVIDSGQVVQRGEASALAAAPANAFVADFIGAVVLTGTVRVGNGELTVVDLDGGGVACSTDPGEGRVALSVYPWEITISQSEAMDESAQNRLKGTITSVTRLGNRVRLGLEAGQPLVAEVTGRAIEELQLAIGREVVASWKATATRLVMR